MQKKHNAGWESINQKPPGIETGGGFPAEVIEIEWLTEKIFSVWLQLPKSKRQPRPGQFFGVRVPEYHHLLLRRPISVAEFHQNKIRLVIRVAGAGTLAMSRTKIGKRWNLLGPLGKPAPIVHNKDVIICGGGIGIAPLLYLTKWLKRHNRITLILGAKTSSELVLLEDFRQLDLPILLTTENGALGKKGVVTDLLPEVLKTTKKPVIYTCGPQPMLVAVKKVANQVTVWGFLEQRLGCGTGICYCCAIKKVTGGYLRLCRDGPVVNLKQVML